MNRIFLEILNHAMISSLLIIAVLIVRICIKKAPKWMTCVLWAMVAVKLVLPFPIESVFSLAPSAKPIPVEQEYLPAPQTEPEVTVADKAVKPAFESEFPTGGTASANPMKTVVSSAAIVWIAGMAVLCFYSLGSYWLLKRRVAVSRKLYDNVYLCDLIDSPFILGILRPGIYFPSGMEQETIECVLEHEKAHLKRYDHIWKPLGFFLLILYWFHPLCWLSYHLFCRDIEFACDEKVTKDKDKEWTANYCQALLDCNVRRRSIAACPVAFGEVGVKDRIKSVLNYRKPAFWIVAAAVILSVVVAVCFMTSPKTDEEIAEPETGAAADELQESGNDQKEPEEAVALTAEKWAQAFCSGDGETILSMAGQEVIEQFEAMEVLGRHGDEVYFSFGSSPMLEWPDGIVPYTIVAQDDTNHTADIIYYAWTSDPHVVVWREQITLTPDSGQYVVSKETLTYCDQIATAEEFLFAYPSGIRDALINYVEVNSLGEDLNNNALLSGGNQYKGLFDPATAVYDLLNIGNKGNMRTEVETSGDVDARSVKIHFPDGIIEIDVCRPYGADGIWLPYDCRLLDASANQLTMQKLVRLVTSYSWIQSQKRERDYILG